MSAPTRTCANCAHWLPRPVRNIEAAGGRKMQLEADSGECRAGPPAQSFRWPHTAAENFCGQWKAKQERRPSQTTLLP